MKVGAGAVPAGKREDDGAGGDETREHQHSKQTGDPQPAQSRMGPASCQARYTPNTPAGAASAPRSSAKAIATSANVDARLMAALTLRRSPPRASMNAAATRGSTTGAMTQMVVQAAHRFRLPTIDMVRASQAS